MAEGQGWGSLSGGQVGMSERRGEGGVLRYHYFFEVMGQIAFRYNDGHDVSLSWLMGASGEIVTR